MVLENLEQAKKFVDFAEELIELLSYDDTDDIYETIIKNYNEIKDYESFKKFYLNFLNDCPNEKVLYNIENEEIIKELFNKANDEISKMVKCSFGLSEIPRNSRNYIKHIFNYEVKLIKEFFKFE